MIKSKVLEKIGCSQVFSNAVYPTYYDAILNSIIANFIAEYDTWIKDNQFMNWNFMVTNSLISMTYENIANKVIATLNANDLENFSLNEYLLNEYKASLLQEDKRDLLFELFSEIRNYKKWLFEKGYETSYQNISAKLYEFYWETNPIQTWILDLSELLVACLVAPNLDKNTYNDVLRTDSSNVDELFSNFNQQENRMNNDE